jgi:hypothetical protein
MLEDRNMTVNPPRSTLFKYRRYSPRTAYPSALKSDAAGPHEYLHSHCHVNLKSDSCLPFVQFSSRKKIVSCDVMQCSFFNTPALRRSFVPPPSVSWVEQRNSLFSTIKKLLSTFNGSLSAYSYKNVGGWMDGWLDGQLQVGG